MIRPGEGWGEPASGDPALDARGGDRELADVAAAHPGALVRFVPDEDCDFARALGLTGRSPGSWVVPVDAFELDGSTGVNMLVVGTRPGRLRWRTPTKPITVVVDGREVFDGGATSVVVANGQFLGGSDLVPRGHPGDGRFEVQVYAVPRGERGRMRRRLPTGTHLPHPAITTAAGRQVEIRAPEALPGELDSRRLPGREHWRVVVVPGALRLLV